MMSYSGTGAGGSETAFAGAETLPRCVLRHLVLVAFLVLVTGDIDDGDDMYQSRARRVLLSHTYIASANRSKIVSGRSSVESFK